MTAHKSWFLYIIQAQNGYLYTGITTDIERRFGQHQSGKGAKFFRSSAARDVIYVEEHVDRSSASRREHQIKRLSRHKKLALVDSSSNVVSKWLPIDRR